MKIETATVKKNRDKFFVTDIDGQKAIIETKQVDVITNNSIQLEEDEVAVLLATIEVARETVVSGGFDKKDVYRAMDEKTKTESIIHLLQQYDIDTLNGIFEEMKYFEIVEVLDSVNPVAVLTELM